MMIDASTSHAHTLMSRTARSCLQHILALEKRFVTNNFSFRFFTSMLGVVVVNAFFAHRHWNDRMVCAPSWLPLLVACYML